MIETTLISISLQDRPIAGPKQDQLFRLHSLFINEEITEDEYMVLKIQVEEIPLTKEELELALFLCSLGL